MQRRSCFAVILTSMLFAGCGGRPATEQEIAAQLNAAREPAQAQVGDLLLRASISPTSSLSETIASRYGVARSPRTVLLLVGVRRVDGTTETSVPATLDAGFRDLRGVQRAIALREVRSDGFIDYVGEVRVSPPDTLTFDITADAGDDGGVRLEFSREVFRP